MKIWVGITDGDWFEYLNRRQPDEVNFWQPSGGRRYRVLQPGELFLFKLHSLQNFIVGGGFFVRHIALPCSLAWSAFCENNGVSSLENFSGGTMNMFLNRIDCHHQACGFCSSVSRSLRTPLCND